MLNSTRLRHHGRYLRQLVSPPTVGIVGGYHGGNLGDMALGRSVQRFLRPVKSGLQTIYTLERWQATPYLFVGGGAVLDQNNLAKIKQKAEGRGERVAIVGVDVEYRDFSDWDAEFLRSCAFVSTRSRDQAAFLVEGVGVQHAEAHPDIVFVNNIGSVTSKREKSLGLNLTPRFLLAASKANGAAAATAKHFVELADQLVAYYLDHGYRVEHVPFTPQDRAVAAQLGLAKHIKHHPYTDDPDIVMVRVGSCDVFFASRYHSVIFALLQKCRTIPFLYAAKSYRLFRDFFPELTRIGVDELQTGEITDAWLEFIGKPVAPPQDRIVSLSAQTRDALQRAAEALHLP